MSHLALFLLLILASLPSEAFAQGSATVAGRVLDMANETPVGFATVVIENAATGTSLSGALAGEDGRFVVQGLTPGTYRFRVTFPGFLEAETDVLVSPLNNTYDLGDIRLPRIEGYKEDVTVTAETIRLAGIDTQVFRMDDGPSQSTGTVLDAMKNLPGVTIDQEGQGLAARQRQGRHSDRREAVEPDRFRQPARPRQPCRPRTSKRSKSSTTPRRGSTRRAWPASSTSSTRRNSSSDGRATSGSAWASASSRGSAATCRPIWEASRTTRRSRQAST